MFDSSLETQGKEKGVRIASFSFDASQYEEVMRIFAGLIGMDEYESKRNRDEWVEKYEGVDSTGQRSSVYEVETPLGDEEYYKVYSCKELSPYLLVTVPRSLLQYYHQESLQNPFYTTAEKLAKQEKVLNQAEKKHTGELDPEITLTLEAYQSFDLLKKE